MSFVEPHATAVLLAVFGALLAAAALFSRAAERVAVPAVLIFLGIGILAGSEGLGGIPFDDYHFAYRLGTVALVLILFDGGLNTDLQALKQAAAPAGVLATVGVVGTAALVALLAYALGVEWPHAMLLGAIVSSTDAAAVFSVLRASGIHLKRRVGVTLEVESGLNDPIAVILTTALTAHVIAPGSTTAWRLAIGTVAHVALGLAVGVAIGRGGRSVLARVRLPSGGLYAVLTLALACLAFGVAGVIGGSGFLAVYVAAVLLGNGPLPYRVGLVRVHDALAWLSQIAMFLVLGLLVYPSRLAAAAPLGLALALFLAIVARPVVVAACLAPFRAYTRREVAHVGWVGLRGAVPIVLATYPVLVGAPGAMRLFDVVFFIVVINAILPGATVPWATRRLGLESSEPPAPQAVMEIESRQPLRGELLSFHVDEALIVTGMALSDLPFPDGAAATLVIRGDELLAPRGNTVLRPGDHVYIVTRPEDRPLIQLMFGRPEDG